jgi:hypothetical protein
MSPILSPQLNTAHRPRPTSIEKEIDDYAYN